MRISYKRLNITICCHVFSSQVKGMDYFFCVYIVIYYSVLWATFSVSLTIVLFIKIYHAKILHAGSAGHAHLLAMLHTFDQVVLGSCSPVYILLVSCPKISAVDFVYGSFAQFCFSVC